MAVIVELNAQQQGDDEYQSMTLLLLPRLHHHLPLPAEHALESLSPSYLESLSLQYCCSGSRSCIWARSRGSWGCTCHPIALGELTLGRRLHNFVGSIYCWQRAVFSCLVMADFRQLGTLFARLSVSALNSFVSQLIKLLLFQVFISLFCAPFHPCAISAHCPVEQG